MRRLQAIWLEGPEPPVPANMEFITPAQAAALVEHSARTGGTVEVYLTGTEAELEALGTPFLGLVFVGGQFSACGLGAPETISWEARVGQSIGLADFEAWVRSA